MPDYDVVIVGSGAGGGTIAHTLAHAGKRILIMERGGFLPREPDNWNPHAVFIDGKYVTPDPWIDGNFKSLQPQSHYFVGGATKLYGAALFRLRPRDFTRYQRADGVSPAWPLSYDQMEPWYTAAEWMYHVHGEHGQDPSAGWASKDYPHPAITHEPRIAELHRDLENAGYHPFPAPSGVLLDEDRPGESACVRCALCDGYPCPVRAKADAETIAVRPILGMPNVTLMTNATAVRLRTRLDDPRRIASVEFRAAGHGTDRVTADTVILSAGAVNSAVILLRSGLANSSDQVGRNYMAHNSRAVLAVSAAENPTRFQKTLALHDFYHDAGAIQMVGRSNIAAVKGEALAAKLIPAWSAERIVRHSLDFWLMSEDLPLPENRVTLVRPSQPGLTIGRKTGTAEMRTLYGRLIEAMQPAGIIAHHATDRSLFMWKGMPLAAVAHQAGTACMGTDPATSVLDVNCRAHDLDNLYVVDASFMPSVGAVNPALTIMANALRVGEHIATGGNA